jgi:hypothetical protein
VLLRAWRRKGEHRDNDQCPPRSRASIR